MVGIPGCQVTTTGSSAGTSPSGTNTTGTSAATSTDWKALAQALAVALKGSSDPTAIVLADNLARAGFGTSPAAPSAAAPSAATPAPAAGVDPGVPSLESVKPAPVKPSAVKSAPVAPANVGSAPASGASGPATTHISSYSAPGATAPCGVQITIVPITGTAAGGN